MIRGEEVARNPFGPPPEKKAVELIECIRGHKTLRDVPIIYGRLGDEAAEIAEKAKSGDVIMGGCFGGSREHWVVCETCGLRFDDEHAAWLDAYPRDELAPVSKRNPQCSLETIRLVLSKELNHFTLELADAKPMFLSCSRWYDSTGIVGERILVQTTLRKTEILVKFEAWLRYIDAPESLDLEILDKDFRTLEWKLKGKSFAAKQNASGKDGFFVEIEWHKEKAEAQQDAP